MVHIERDVMGVAKDKKGTQKKRKKGSYEGERNPKKMRKMHDAYGRKSSQPPWLWQGFAVEDLAASYLEWFAHAFHRCGLHLAPGTQRLEEPVSKMTEKFCSGVPSYLEEE